SRGPTSRRRSRPGSRMRLEPASPVRPALLDLDGGPLLLERGLHLRRIVLADVLLHGLGSAVHQVLRLLEAEAGQLAHDLDDLDLLVAGGHQHHVELGLLLHHRGRAAGARARGHRHQRSRGRDAELLLVLLLQLRELEHRHVANQVEHLIDRSGHCWILLLWGVTGLRFRWFVRTSRAKARRQRQALRLSLSSTSAITAGSAIVASIAASSVVIGAMNVASNWDSSTSRLGSAASLAIACSSKRRPSTTAALMRGFSCSFAKSDRILAGAISLTGLNTRPVGPSRNASSALMPRSLNARLSSVFLITLNCTFCSRQRLRSSESFSTLMPLKSAR